MNIQCRVNFLMGVVICTLLGFLAALLINHFSWLNGSGLSLLTLAIVLGMALGNLPILFSVSKEISPGIQFVKQRILRLGIIFYGLRLTFQDISNVGYLGVSIDVAIFLSTFALSIYFGLRHLKLDKETAILIGAGSSICGAAAILATEPVVKARNEKVTVAISTVVIFGTISIFTYPLLFQLGHHYFAAFEFPMQFGIYIGSTIHEVAQVLAVANSVGGNVTDIAVITKMMRVMMLVPFLILLPIFCNFLDIGNVFSKNSGPEKNKISFLQIRASIPWFAFAFILVIILNSFGVFPKNFIEPLIEVDNLMLAAAMAALGLTTRLSAIKEAGLRPLFLAFVLFVWLVFGGAFINIIFNIFWNFS